MEYRDLGRTGMRVSEIGFGAWAIGGDAWGPVEDADSLAAMERALELGINFIDTADVYGDGRSESLVSKAISGKRDEVILSTKGGLMGHGLSQIPEPGIEQVREHHPDELVGPTTARQLHGRYPALLFCPYSPKCLEDEFSEVS